MASEDKVNEARLEAAEILKLSQDEIVELFYRQTKRRKLARMVRQLDRLALEGGDDAGTAQAALERLGFSLK